MIFGNKNKKGKRTLKEFDSQKLRLSRKKTTSGKTKKPHFFRRSIFYFLMIIFLGTTVYLVFFSGFLAVSSIVIQGNEMISQRELRGIMDSKLEGKYFNFLEKNNLIFLDEKSIKNILADRFKVITGVEVVKDFPSSVILFVTERKPSAILVSGGNVWAVDEKGEIFDEAGIDSSYLDRKHLPVVFDETNKSFRLGDLVMSEKFISFISDFRRKAGEASNIEFENEIEVPGISSGDVRMKTKEGWTILLDENIGADKETEMLQAVLENKIEKEKRPNLEYIDLRISNKVFYKYKDGTQEETSEEVSDEVSKETVPTIPEQHKKDKKTKEKD